MNDKIDRFNRSIFITAIIMMMPLLICAVAIADGTLQYKNYIIRYDRGWDILCDPYTVQKDDWVYKIFREKGEISHNDFREFLGIFERINPHIGDINTIRPGQRIDIPLKKLQKGTLPGQSSGVVSIPFITISSAAELITKNSTAYTIQKGDTVSKLIAGQFGRYGTQSYREGVKMLQAVNPHITDLNKIYAGQTIYLPDSAIQNQSWYGSLYDASGNLVDQVKPSEAPPKQPLVPSPPTAGTDKPPGFLDEIAAVIDGKLHSKGTYYVPGKADKDIEIDLSRFPVIEGSDGTRYLITPDGKVMGKDPKELEPQLKGIKVVKIKKGESAEKVLETLLGSEGEVSGKNMIAVSSPGVEAMVRSKWIKTASDNDTPRHICITPIASVKERTPESIFRFLDQHDIVLKEIISSGNVPPESPGVKRYAIGNFDSAIRISPADQKKLVKEIFMSMGYHYSPNISISFPYAGIQVQAMSNLLSSGKGKEVLVDFGDLYGDAIDSIRKTGLKVVQISVEDDPESIIRKLLKAIGVSFKENPLFFAADRSTDYNTAITIHGLMLSTPNHEKTLVTQNVLHPEIVDFLLSSGVKVVMMG